MGKSATKESKSGTKKQRDPGSGPRPVQVPTITSEAAYEKYLREAEGAVDRVYTENACPTAKLVDFKAKGLLGAGGFGDVYLVEHKGSLYALKVKYKLILRREQVEYAIDEKKLMYAIRNNFIVQLFYAFQDSRNLYLVMERAFYGDFTRFDDQTLPEQSMKLYAAQLILAVEYLHTCKILHRDLKVDNVFLFEDAYLKVGDFGLSRKGRDRTNTIIGGVHYFPPEMAARRDYGTAADWWCVGVFLYELAYKGLPFGSFEFSDRQNVHCILNDDLEFPPNVDPDSPMNKLIEGFLAKETHRRLGAMQEGAREIKRHPWFVGISFLAVFNKTIQMSTTLKERTAKRDPNRTILQGVIKKNYTEFSEF